MANFRTILEGAKSADTTASFVGWCWKIAEFLFPTAVAGLLMWAASYRDWIWNDNGVFGLMVVGICGAVLVGLAFYLFAHGLRTWRSPAAKQLATNNKPLELIEDKFFRNCEVPLDGKHYNGCTFENVTFVHNGGNGKLTHNKLKGFSIRTDVPEINTHAMLLNDLGFLKVPAFSHSGIRKPTNPIPDAASPRQ